MKQSTEVPADIRERAALMKAAFPSMRLVRVTTDTGHSQGNPAWDHYCDLIDKPQGERYGKRRV